MSSGPGASLSDDVSHGSYVQLLQMITNVMKVVKKELEGLLTLLCMRKRPSSSFLDNETWHKFFATMSATWTPPAPSFFGGALLRKVYENIMGTVTFKISEANVGVFGIDRATNRLAKSVRNVIVHKPTPFFVEFLRADLKRETKTNVVDKIKNVIKLLDDVIDIKFVFAFVVVQ